MSDVKGMAAIPVNSGKDNSDPIECYQLEFKGSDTAVKDDFAKKLCMVIFDFTIPQDVEEQVKFLQAYCSEEIKCAIPRNLNTKLENEQFRELLAATVIEHKLGINSISLDVTEEGLMIAIPKSVITSLVNWYCHVNAATLETLFKIVGADGYGINWGIAALNYILTRDIRESAPVLSGVSTSEIASRLHVDKKKLSVILETEKEEEKEKGKHASRSSDLCSPLSVTQTSPSSSSFASPSEISHSDDDNSGEFVTHLNPSCHVET